jgi:phage shock protein A
MGIFSRLFKIGQAEAHNAINKLEDPIKMAQQGIRDLKEDLDKSLHALAQVKAISIRTRNDAETAKQKMVDYEKKAVLLLQRAQQGQIDPAEADRLAAIALEKKEEAKLEMERNQTEYERHEASVSKLDGKIKQLRQHLSKWENELRTLEARAKVSTATKNVNKQLSQIDSSGTIAMLERMKEKVQQDEALSDAYADIADESRTVDEELNKAIDKTNTSASDALAALKAKMNLTPPV